MKSHHHEFVTDEQSPILEDGRCIFYERCQHREINGSYHSEKHDETFYDEGPQCGADRHYHFELTTVHVYNRDDGWRAIQDPDPNDPSNETVERAVINAETGERKAVGIDPDSSYGDAVFRVYVEDEVAELRYEA